MPKFKQYGDTDSPVKQKIKKYRKEESEGRLKVMSKARAKGRAQGKATIEKIKLEVDHRMLGVGKANRIRGARTRLKDKKDDFQTEIYKTEGRLKALKRHIKAKKK